MALRTILSVNGRDGASITNDHDGHLVPFSSVAAVPGNAGRPGIDAPPRNQGEHAGIIQVEILRSSTAEGGILVKAVKQKGSKLIAPETEIAPRCKLHFTAIGGRGESGRAGGNGENGTVGETGNPATRDSEATGGGSGGDGGNAGSGSDGANGGNGGTVQLIVDENDVELLYGISCDASGGPGGDAGTHGSPGHGGKGGSGGTSIVWEDVVDHRYRCTPSCVGRSTTTAVLPNQRDATLDMFRRFQEEASRQSPLSRAMTRTIFAAHRATPADAGADLTHNQGVCRCRGGGDNCPGCETIPIYRTFSRPAGRDGPDGALGNLPRTQTVQGRAGQPGRFSVVIRKKNGQGLEGNSCFGLKLVEFDVEDSNADGIFEPGEDIFVRRIQIHNPGGVVSPVQHIPCRLSTSDCITMESSLKTKTHLPTSIPPGSIKTAAGEIKARLSTVVPAVNSLPPYERESSISISATMPWTSLPVEDFNITKLIKLQFPVEIRNIKVPATIISGSKSKITWKLFNKSSRPFGISQNYDRYAKVVLTVASKHGQVQDHNNAWGNTSTLTAALIDPMSSIDMSQNLRVDTSISGHSELDVTAQLFLSSPQQTRIMREPVITEMQLVETHALKIKVAPGHNFSPEDDVLLVTNSGTRHRDIAAITDFFQSTLSLNLGVWNASTYGGLVKQDTGEQHVESILSYYGGRTVVLLANSFPLLQGEEISATSLFDPLSLLAANQSGTYCVLFGFSNTETDRAVLDALFRPIEGETSSWTQSLPAHLRHETFESLIESFSHSSCGADRCHIVAVRKVMLKSREKNMAQSAKDLASKLHHDLPSYHFNICIIPRQPSDPDHIDGHLLVQVGLSRAARFLAAHAEILKSNERVVESQINLGSPRRRATTFKRALTTLTAHDKLTLLSALPIATLMGILDQEKRKIGNDDALLIELSIERQIDAEVQSLAKLASKVKLKDKLRDDFLRESLPTMSQVIDHIQGRKYLSSETRRVLAYCFASSKPQNRGGALVEGINPFAQTRKQIQKLLQQSLGREKDFKIDGLLESDDRRVSSTLAARINKVTGQALYFQELSSYSPLQSLCNNDILTMEEWDAAARRTTEMEDAVINLFDRFQIEREQFEVHGEPVEADRDSGVAL